MKKIPSQEQPADIDPRFAPVVEAFAADPEVGAGRMMASFGLKVNGKIFAMVVKGRLVVKLPGRRVDELVEGGAGEYFDPGHGRLMKEWIAVTDEGADWLGLAKEAHGYVRG